MIAFEGEGGVGNIKEWGSVLCSICFLCCHFIAFLGALPEKWRVAL